MSIQKSIIDGAGVGSLRINKRLLHTKKRKKDVYQMDFKNVDESIEFRDPLKYQKDFLNYLIRTSKMSFQIIGEDINISVPYKHRWSKSYRKGILSKFISLGIWAKRHKLTCGMLSLTSAQSGYTDFEILERFKESWYKFSGNLRKMGYQYVMLYEPHKSGVPHIHALLIGDCSEKSIDRLESLWHKKYKMGVKGYDFDFSIGLKENLESIVNYLMKYMSKTIVHDFMNDTSMVRFHSLFYQTGSRLFTSSRYLSFVMKKHRSVIRKISVIYLEDAEMYNVIDAPKIPLKNFTWRIRDGGNGQKYRLELLPFEIKGKKERKYEFKPFDSYFMKRTSEFFDMASYINL